MTHLLDTNTCVEFLRRGQGTPVAARLAAQLPGSVVLCSVVVAELLYGAERSNAPATVRGQVAAFVAVAHGLTLVTHNTAEFGRVPALVVEDWQTP